MKLILFHFNLEISLMLQLEKLFEPINSTELSKSYLLSALYVESILLGWLSLRELNRVATSPKPSLFAHGLHSCIFIVSVSTFHTVTIEIIKTFIKNTCILMV